MKTAYIVSTGTELLLGDTADSNALFLSRELSALGLRVIGRATVGDNREMIKKALRGGLDLADIVICTGGLGPTADDLSREAAGEVLDLALDLNEAELQKIKDYFSRRRRDMPESNRKQALFPPGAFILPNRRGTASGFMVSPAEKTLVLLPGPPHEMELMYEKELEPRLRDWLGETAWVMISKTLKVMGPGESQVEALIEEVMADPEGCSIALLAVEGEVHIRVSRDAAGAADAEAVVDRVISRMRKCLGNHVYGEAEATLEGAVISMLRRQGHSLALAESCTGGLVGKMLTDVPGSSACLWGGAISYSNDAKTRILGINEETLKRYGAVSPETAREMARGIRKLAGSTYGLSLTGIAGPEGGSPEKPVGLVYLGLAAAEGEETREMRFLGARNSIRTLAAKSALDWLRRRLEQE